MPDGEPYDDDDDDDDWGLAAAYDCCICWLPYELLSDDEPYDDDIAEPRAAVAYLLLVFAVLDGVILRCE